MPESVFITGSNRGIGLALVKEYVARGAKVFATSRRPDELTALPEQYGDQVSVLPLDVTQDESVSSAAETVASQIDALDILINNAAVYPEPSVDVKLGDLDLQDVRDAFETNVLGVARVTRALIALVGKARHGRIVNISSGAGCIATKDEPGHYGYGTSKAALNYFTRAMAAEFAQTGVIIVAMSPGWVKTEMGGPQATITTEVSARGIADTIAKLTPTDNGLWYTYEGTRRDTW
jgi:NAD(P)-dependent dehydrogenase (short-subunit alcohol dehydrogenase family)